MAFDGIVTKKVTDELQNIKNYKIDKIYQPDKNTIILGLYGRSINVNMLACISSNNYRIHLTKHIPKNPFTALNFCMLLRKHILGYKIKKIYTKELERVVFIELENCENPEKPIYKTLIIELMGKHSNIILVNESGIIIDSIRHTSTEEKSQRDIYPTARYIFPKSSKYNLLEISSFEEFYSKLDIENNEQISDISNIIANTFNGISFKFINNLIEDSNADKYIDKNSVSENNLLRKQFNESLIKKLYNEILEILKCNNLTIKITEWKNSIPRDYTLDYSSKEVDYELNYSLDEFYSYKESSELFINYRNTILNLILANLKKYEKRLANIDNKLSECLDMDKYKLYGELITANLYKMEKYNVSSIQVENYYDNNNLIEIPLDKKYSPSYNAKRYFKKYNKLKTALEVVGIQKEETKSEIKYIESIVYELENACTLEDIQEIYNEISENSIFQNKVSKTNKLKNNKKSSKQNMKAKKLTANKFASFNPLKYVIDGYTIFVGRNNKENDYLTNKFANKNDIWFHTKDVHGSHVIIKTNPGENIPEQVLYEAAKLAVSHSKAKNSSNVPVDYCQVRFVKKVPGNKPGLVIYSNNHTIYVE